MFLRRVVLAALAVALAAATVLPGTASAIDGGDPSAPGYVARIDVVRSATSTWTCSGALLAPRLVVTAAHCLYSARPDDWTVTLARGTAAAEARDVVAAVPYPGTPPAEDLAVLVLDRPVAQAPVALDGAPGAVPGLLPGVTTATPAAGSPVVAAGYGAVRPGGNMSPVARRAAQVVERIDSRSGTPSMLLTRPAPGGVAPTPGVCELGDSGGPLVSGPTLWGILSEGNSAADVCWYTRLDRGAPARAWLDTMIAQHGGAPVVPSVPTGGGVRQSPAPSGASSAAPAPVVPGVAVPGGAVPGVAVPAAAVPTSAAVPGVAVPAAAAVPGVAVPGVAVPGVAVPGAAVPGAVPATSAPMLVSASPAARDAFGSFAGTAAGHIAAGAPPTPEPAPAVPIFTADAFAR